MRAAGIILAAGRGSRMKNLTAHKPKCLLELAGRPLLRWQLEALKKAGLEQILVVRGYAGDCLAAERWKNEFTTAENQDWERTNMLSTLLCANDFVQKAFGEGIERVVVSYSDIVYHPDHVLALLGSGLPIAITYDTLWQDLWRLRLGADALSDVETFRQENGLLREIGGKTQNMADIAGQYMGLLSFSQAGWQTLLTACEKLGNMAAKTDMTGFLSYLLADGAEIGTVPVKGRWCEADSGSDMQKYVEALQKGNWTHDWRDK